MNRIGFLTAVSLAVCIPLTTSFSAESDRPNVLFIAVDDLNDWIGCLGGHPQAQTPNIDRLAKRGVLFSNAHCAAPACNPSRAAVFSGRMPNASGVWSNKSPKLGRLQPTWQTLPEAFQASGYQTMGTGKLSGEKSRFAKKHDVEQRWSPLNKSSVQYTAAEMPSKGTRDPRHELLDSQQNQIVLPLNRMPSDRRPDTDDGESFDWGPFDVPDSDFGDTQITDWAIEQINQHADQPFFLGVGYYRPHIPLWAPASYFQRFKDNPAQLPEVKSNDLADLSAMARKWAKEPVTAGSHSTVLAHDQWRQAVEAYLACITYVDFEIGRLLDALYQSDLSNNTVIVLWSDHGWHLGEKEHWGKWTGWERSSRVPLIIIPPTSKQESFAAAGSICEQPVGLIDLYPTLTELCDVPPPSELEGTSLVPLLRTPEKETGRIVVTMFDQGNISLRSKDWRYIRYSDGTEELYDHRSDPNEWNNLSQSPRHEAQKRQFQLILETPSYHQLRAPTAANP